MKWLDDEAFIVDVGKVVLNTAPLLHTNWWVNVVELKSIVTGIIVDDPVLFFVINS